MVALRSTSLVDAVYDNDTEELVLTFSNGKTYSYPGVPPETYRQLLLAPSAGAFYHSQIKGRYG